MIDLESMSILVVDDMKSMRLTIRKMLRNLTIGKTLRFAENGKAGLDILKSTPCDLAIIDWNMPVMNGSQMLDRLRRDKVLRDMPVIMVTAESERDIVSEVAEHDIHAYLLKPLTLAALDEKIRRVVDRVNNPDEPTLHMLKARELEESGDIQGAIDQIRKALVHRPSASRILRKLGLLHFKLGKPAIGIKCLRKAICVNRQDTISRDHLARVLIKRKEYSHAAKIYQEILGLSTRYFESAVQLGETMFTVGYKAEAMGLFSRIISRSRGNPGLRDKILEICTTNHEFQFALGIMKQALRENPSNIDLMMKMGKIYMTIGDYEQAMPIFRTIDSSKKGDVDAKLEIARIYHLQGRVLQADDYVRQVLQIDANNPQALALRQAL